jgi:hypothetical protein
MKKYKVILECHDLVTLEVEAVSKKEAEAIAKNEARGQVFGDSFTLYEINEVGD